jgi:ABC-type amino acid transport substrate-binding protein
MFGVRTLGAAVAVMLAVGGSASAQDDLLASVKKNGTLRVCAINYTPWNILDPVKSTWDGINVEIVNEIGKALDVKVAWVDSAWSTIIQNVKTNKCELAAAALWTSPPRAENVSFTRPVGGDGSTLFVPADSNIARYEDIDQPGKTITVLSGSADERLAKETFKKAQVKSLVTDQVAAHILEVASNRADAAFGGFAGNAQFIASNPNIRVKPLPDLLVNYVPFAYAVPAKEYFFRDYISTVIGNLDSSGKLEAIKARWTKTPK